MYECIDQFGRTTCYREDYDGVVRHFVRNTAVQYVMADNSREMLLYRKLAPVGKLHGNIWIAMPSDIPAMSSMDVGVEFVNYEPDNPAWFE